MSENTHVNESRKVIGFERLTLNNAGKSSNQF